MPIIGIEIPAAALHNLFHNMPEKNFFCHIFKKFCSPGKKCVSFDTIIPRKRLLRSLWTDKKTSRSAIKREPVSLDGRARARWWGIVTTRKRDISSQFISFSVWLILSRLRRHFYGEQTLRLSGFWRQTVLFIWQLSRHSMSR